MAAHYRRECWSRLKVAARWETWDAASETLTRAAAQAGYPRGPCCATVSEDSGPGRTQRVAMNTCRCRNGEARLTGIRMVHEPAGGEEQISFRFTPSRPMEICVTDAAWEGKRR